MRIATVVQTVRRLLAEGLMGSDFHTRLTELTPGLPAETRRAALKRVAREYGVLGHALHDPNLYKSCHIARVAKVRHPHKDTLVATKTTARCPGCTFNRRGTCGLMGGTLVASAEGITQGHVETVATRLVANRRLREDQAEEIVNSIDSPRRRVARLRHAVGATSPTTSDHDLTDMQRSVRAGAILDPAGSGATITPRALHGTTRVRNADRRDADLFVPRAGDAAVSRRAAQVGAALAAPGIHLDIRPPAPKRKQSVKIASRPMTHVPAAKVASRRVAGPADDFVRVQVAYEGLLGQARKLLASGRMTAGVAGRYHERIAHLAASGARSSAVGQGIARQVALLAGDLEL